MGSCSSSTRSGGKSMRAVPSGYREVVTELGLRVRSRFETNGFGQVIERIILDYQPGARPRKE